ncbi:unnamed protein product [Closterium sp. Naga37s-1]|nr:unnamed protein product [Closterium sp. Naga37s-1]
MAAAGGITVGSLVGSPMPFAASQAAEAAMAEASEAAYVATAAVMPLVQKTSTVNEPLSLRALPPVRQLRAVLFDIDGTLTDSDPLHFLAFQRMLSDVGFDGGRPIDEAFFRTRISGRHNPDIGRDLFPEWTEEQRTAFLDEKEALFRRLAGDHIKPVAGLDRLCAWIEATGLRRAAVTNAPRENAEQMLAALGLTSFFEHLIIGSECARAKPFPDPYQEAMRRFGVRPDECFACEDSPSGMRAAVAANLATVGVLTGNTEDALYKAGAAIVVRDYDDPLLWSQLTA